MWRTGRLSYESVDEAKLKLGCRLDKYAETQDQAKFMGGWWSYRNQCNFKVFHPPEAAQVLNHHLIVFAGDSLLRQMFNRLVTHLRGFHDVVEHYYHGHAMYMQNRTHDIWEIASDNRTTFPTIPSADVLAEPSLYVLFWWDPTLQHIPDLQAQLSLRFPSYFRKVIVTGMHFWPSSVEQNVKSMNDIPRLLHAMNVAKSPALFVWYPGWDKAFAERNKKLMQWALHQPNVQILPSVPMATSMTYPTMPDGVHFQCSYLTKIDQPIHLNEYKAPANGDCHDGFNTNLVQMVLNMVSRRFSPKYP